jgi:Tfp pilus assembly protein PilV
MKKHAGKRGTMLLETMVTGVMVATASLGAAAALVSGLSLEQKSDRTMSEVATAENLMERIRHSSQTDFTQMRTDFHQQAFASRESTGGALATLDPIAAERIATLKELIASGNLTEEDRIAAMKEIETILANYSDKEGVRRSLAVSMPNKEADLPNAMDLDGNGEFDNTVDIANARLMVVDLAGSDKLRLRTAVLNQAKMKGIIMDRSERRGNRPVKFGETRDPDAEPTTGGGTTTTTTVQEKTDSLVSVVSATIEGTNALVTINNTGTGDRKPVSITIAPNDDALYFEKITLGGTTIFTPADGQASGTVTIPLTTEATLAPGEGQMAVNGFFKYDKKKNAFVAKAPKSVTITVAFDDGSFFSADA